MITTSNPSHGAPQCRAASRRTRRLRLRSTALPSRLPATNATRPRGPRSVLSVGAAMTTACVSLPRAPVLKSSSISRDDLMVLSTDASGRRHGTVLGAQDLSPFASTPRQNRAAACGTHTLAEAVCLATLPVIGLVRAFHLSSFRHPAVPSAKPDDCIQAPPVKSTDSALFLAGPAEAAVYLSSASRLVVPAQEQVGNLWILWKTQDAPTPYLWIVWVVPLLGLSPDATIRHAARLARGVLDSLKTAARCPARSMLICNPNKGSSFLRIPGPGSCTSPDEYPQPPGVEASDTGCWKAPRGPRFRVSWHIRLPEVMVEPVSSTSVESCVDKPEKPMWGPLREFG